MNSSVDENSARSPVLVVDDEPMVLATIEQTLRAAGHPVVCHADPLRAVAELQAREFSVIVSDQRMPGLSGLELLARARSLRPLATRILITAVLELDTVIAAINKGEIYRFIIKPWLHEEFLVAVSNAVQRHDLLRQNARLFAVTEAMNAQLRELNHSLERQVDVVARQNCKLAEANAALERNLARSIELCVRTMETFHPSLGTRARRVAQLCGAMADVLDLPAEERRVLESSAWLHDLGLMAVPRQLIKKWQENSEALTPAERALIQQHPILGQELAAFTSDLDAVGRVIRAHHERFDGRGYPDGLMADRIPWLARLLAVAVAFAAHGPDETGAAEKLQQGAGLSFDPEAVRVLLRTDYLSTDSQPERQVGLADLRPGMVVARGVYTQRGVLLVPEGQRLSATSIEKLLNHDRIQPIKQSLMVYC